MSYLWNGIANCKALQSDVLATLYDVLALGLSDKIRSKCGRIFINAQQSLVIACVSLGGDVIVCLAVIAPRVRWTYVFDYHKFATGQTGVFDQFVVFKELYNWLGYGMRNRTCNGNVVALGYA